MNPILQKRIEEAAKQTACPQCVFNDGGTCNNDDDCKLFDDFVGLMTFALQNQWISVEEALPEFQQDVVVTNSKGDYWTAWRLNDNCEDTDDNGFVNYGIGEITHWMAIPQLKGGEE